MTRQTSVRQFELKEKILSSQDKRTKIEQLRQIRTNIEQLRQIMTNIEYVGQKDKNSVIRTEGTNNVEYIGQKEPVVISYQRKENIGQ